MKNIILFLLGIIAILGIVAIVKNNYIFSFGDKERLDKGWKAYESKDYGFAISQFSAVDYNKHPEVILPLADSYLEINEVKPLQEPSILYFSYIRMIFFRK